MFNRLFRRSSSTASKTRQPLLEKLEDRALFAATNPTVTAATADNRGEVLVTFDQADWTNIVGTSLNKNSVQMYAAGPDGHLGNADDVRVPASIRYTSANGRLLVRAEDIAAGIGYRIKVVAARVTTTNGGTFDGNFKSGGASGDGVAGGNYEFQVKNDKATEPTVRMSTSLGTINLIMRGDVAPKSVKNFLNYANSGRYDNIFFTRSISGFIIQGGSLQITGDGSSLGDVTETTLDSPVVNEYNLSNTVATLAFAKQGGDPNSATNQFFFNLGDNSSNLNNQNGGFTVFAQIKGLDTTVINQIAGLATEDLSSQITSAATDVSTVPVIGNPSSAANTVPATNFVTIRRTAQVSKIAAL